MQKLKRRVFLITKAQDIKLRALAKSLGVSVSETVRRMLDQAWKNP